MHSYSIIVPSYKSLYLAQVLDSFESLNPPGTVIAVDAFPEVIVVDAFPDKTPGRARNEGAWQAHGEYLIFVDADVAFTDETRAFVFVWLAQENPTAVCGIYHPGIGSIANRLQNSILAARAVKSSSHFIIRKDDFKRIGGFNEELRTWEDVEFFRRCALGGVDVTINKAFVATHLKQFTVLSLLVDYFVKTRNALQARLRYPALLNGKLAETTWTRSWWQAREGWHGLKLATPSLLVLIAFTIAVAILVSMLQWLSATAKRQLVSLADWIRAAYRVLARNGMPVQIIHYVTARCNLRCEHCFYKETLDAPDAGEQSLETFERVTQQIGPVLWYSLGGGEPFIRKDLKQIIAIIHKNCRPKILSFPTNGWYTERTFLTTLRILQSAPEANLILFFSVDGSQQVHDQIRGATSFEKVRKTMDRLRPLQAIYPNLYLNVITTITERNAIAAPELIDEIVRDFQPNAISINLFRYHSLEHPPLPEYVIEGYRQAVERYAHYLRSGALKHYGFIGGRILLAKEILQKDLIYRVAKNNEFVTPCTAGTLSYVIMEDGSTKPCEILSDVMPRLAFKDMVRSPAARKLRRRIRDTQCRCTYECAQSTNTLFSWPMSGRLARSLVMQ